jgi:hypothetical protein
LRANSFFLCLACLLLDASLLFLFGFLSGGRLSGQTCLFGLTTSTFLRFPTGSFFGFLATALGLFNGTEMPQQTIHDLAPSFTVNVSPLLELRAFLVVINLLVDGLLLSRLFIDLDAFLFFLLVAIEL